MEVVVHLSVAGSGGTATSKDSSKHNWQEAPLKKHQ